MVGHQVHLKDLAHTTCPIWYPNTCAGAAARVAAGVAAWTGALPSRGRCVGSLELPPWLLGFSRNSRGAGNGKGLDLGHAAKSLTLLPSMCCTTAVMSTAITACAKAEAVDKSAIVL